MNTSTLNKEISFVEVFSLIVFMVLTSGYILYQLLPNNFNNNFLIFGNDKDEKKVFILDSSENVEFLKSQNLNYQYYKQNLQKIAKKFEKNGFKTELISEKDILNIPSDSILMAFDTYKVSFKSLTDIKSFITRGGTFVFNYHFGYFEDKFKGPSTIEEITKLTFVTESIPKSATNFFIPNIMSPLIKTDIKSSKRYDLVLYGKDVLPIFKSSYTPDLILTNWEITSPPLFNNNPLKVDEAGIAWHGFMGNGKWFYFSTPSYFFIDMQDNLFRKIFDNIFTYSTSNFVISKYPFIDYEKVVFISEDTEYKYENMYPFSLLAKKYDINVTLFCVAKLAQQHKKITAKTASLENVEIGSHSYSHTKIMNEPIEKIKKEIEGSKEILQQITGKKVYGFRPPREEIDKTMEEVLKESGYRYIMEKTKDFLLPMATSEGLTTIPRHGTDDYIYLINLNWEKEKIVKKIIQETNMLTSIHALYTLSVHTHLLSYKNNLSVSAKYFKYLNRHKDIAALKGKDINLRARLLPNIYFKKEVLGKNILIKVYNNNKKEVKNFSFRLFWPNIKIKGIIPVDIATKIEMIKNNPDRRFSDYKINRLKPNSSTEFIINYEKNSYISNAG